MPQVNLENALSLRSFGTVITDMPGLKVFFDGYEPWENERAVILVLDEGNLPDSRINADEAPPVFEVIYPNN
jgi:hypothetical protein